MLSVAQVAFEPGCSDAEHARGGSWAARSRPKKCRSDTSSHQAIGRRDIQELAAHPAAFALSGSARQPNLTMVLDYYERPNWLRPEGAHTCVVAGSIVAQGPWQFPFTDRLNIVVARDTQPHRWTGQSILDGAGVAAGGREPRRELATRARVRGLAEVHVPRGVDQRRLAERPSRRTAVLRARRQRRRSPDGRRPPRCHSGCSSCPPRFEAEIDAVLGDYPIACARRRLGHVGLRPRVARRAGRLPAHVHGAHPRRSVGPVRDDDARDARREDRRRAHARSPRRVGRRPAAETQVVGQRPARPDRGDRPARGRRRARRA